MNNIEILKNNNVDVDEALKLWGDLDSYNEALEEYANTLDSKLVDLEGYKNANDLYNYSILVHGMKSEAKYLGFMQDAEVFFKHETESKAGNQNYINTNFHQVRETAFHIIDVIKTYFGENNQLKKILIADDSTIILSFLEKHLNKEEFQILKANSGAEALNILKSNFLYAIILDLNMPGVNGFAVLDYLKENNLIDSIPVVIITGDDSEDTIQKAFSYHILDVLNKPFNEKNIERVLDSIKSFYSNK